MQQSHLISGSGPSVSSYPRCPRRPRRRTPPPPALRIHELGPRPFQHHELRRWVTPVFDFDKDYFDSYSHLGVHEEMIMDRVRTDTYRAAIMYHQTSIARKVVVDVGYGTSILSIFCAQASAKRARIIVEANNLSDVIIVLQGRVESMLGSIITARGRWLKPEGLILPSDAKLYMAPVTNTNRYIERLTSGAIFMELIVRIQFDQNELAGTTGKLENLPAELCIYIENGL